MASRPVRLVGVVGTATDVGKTWVASRWLARLRAQGLRVAARKPVQSYAVDTTQLDAKVLADATGEPVQAVCRPHRSYELPMAPPIAANRLDRPRIYLDELVDEMAWPNDIDVGLVETVGGACSPLAHDADSVDLLRRLMVDDVLLVADAGLGAINAVRLTLARLAGFRTVVFLNRFDRSSATHVANVEWLERHDRLRVLTEVTHL
jgi:dethiobiotin synthetase